MDVLGRNRVKGTPYVEKGCQAVGPGVYVAFNIVDKTGRGSLSQAIAPEPMLLGMKRA